MAHGARPLRSTRRLANLTSELPRWYKIVRNQAGPTLISIYDEIGFFGVPAASFLDELRTVQGDIELHMHSPGGDIYEGLAIYNGLLQARQRGNVQVVIDGLAASAASFIAMAATPGMLEVAPHSRVMIHDGFCMAIGNAADMRELANQLDQESDNIAGIYADRTGKPQAYWRDKMQAETWYTDVEAVAEGLADRIHGQDETPADDWDMSVFANYAGLRNTLVRNADASTADDGKVQCPTCKGKGKILEGNRKCPDCQGAGRVTPEQAADLGDKSPASGNALHGNCPQCSADTPHGARFCAQCGTSVLMAGDSGWVQDSDGTWRFDPDGDGDDDSTPEGDTDHDYFDEDGNPIPGKTVPPKPSGAQAGNRALLPALLNADVDNSAWDASKAWAAGAASDDPAAFYKGICAGRKAGDPSTQGAWALPYKYTPSSPPNAGGVRNALARLSQTEGLTNKSEAQSVLEKAMKLVNPDYQPDDEIDIGLLSAALLIGLERG